MSNLNTVNVSAGKINATGLITTSSGLELPVYDSADRPDDSETGTLIWNRGDDGVVNIKTNTGWLNISGGTGSVWTTSTRPTTPPVGTYAWNTETNSLEVYDGTNYVKVQQDVSGGAGGTTKGTAADPATSAQEIYNLNGAQPADGLYYIDTPNGGSQQIYCVFDNGVGWMVVGKFNGDASSTVTGTITTTRGLTVQDSTGTEFSADFGDFNPSLQRFIGCNNISTWRNDRNLDWWYGVPTNRLWKNFWTNGRSSGMDNVRRYGFTTAGAWDGRGRWANPNYTFYQVSDNNTDIDTSDFTNSGSFNLNGGDDAKFGVDSFNSTSGQDEEVMVQFGHDDGRRCFIDRFPDRDGGNSNRRDYSTAVYCLIH